MPRGLAVFGHAGLAAELGAATRRALSLRQGVDVSFDITHHTALPHLPPRTAGQSLSSLQVPASPEDVSQSPPAPVLPTLTWLLAWLVAQESSQIFAIQSQIIVTWSANTD